MFSLEALFTNIVIHKYEVKDVETFGVPGAYLHAEISKDKRVILKLKVDFVDILCIVSPDHEKNVVIEKGKDVLYLLVVRAICGCI